jgi:hypothetical protein
VTAAITEEDDWFAGEDQNIEWDIRDKAGTPVDISGWTIVFKMSATKGGSTALTKTATVITASRCRVSPLAADTLSLAPRNYWGQLSRTDSGFNQVLWDERCLLQSRVT